MSDRTQYDELDQKGPKKSQPDKNNSLFPKNMPGKLQVTYFRPKSPKKLDLRARSLKTMLMFNTPKIPIGRLS